MATFSLRVPVSGAVAAEQIEPGRFNPFIFATNERLRNSIFTDDQGRRVAPGDGLEIHLKTSRRPGGPGSIYWPGPTIAR